MSDVFWDTFIVSIITIVTNRIYSAFFELIQQLDKVDGIERYRISSIEPNLLTEEMIDWITSGTKFLPHYHIPLQSGCDTILREMGRRYDTAAFAHKIEYIRTRTEVPGGPKVFFGIDVIVGFPGETDELFMETYNFLKDVVKKRTKGRIEIYCSRMI